MAVASLGGTITMTPASGGGAVTPSLQAADLVAAVPGLDEVAELTVATLRTEPGAWLTPPDVVAVGEWARGQVVDGGVDGVVVVQGTDTIEETAYLLDLYWDRPEPLVVSGAMRAPSAAGADGPANLLAATVVAASAGARDRGALVVLNDDVHAAARVRKTDTVALSRLRLPAVRAGRPGARAHGDLRRRTRALAGPPAAPSPAARPASPCWRPTSGDRGDLLRLVAEDGYDGVVLAGFGAGHVSAAMAEVVSEVVPRCPVVLASRTGAGPVLTGDLRLRRVRAGPAGPRRAAGRLARPAQGPAAAVGPARRGSGRRRRPRDRDGARPGPRRSAGLSPSGVRAGRRSAPGSAARAAWRGRCTGSTAARAASASPRSMPSVMPRCASTKLCEVTGVDAEAAGHDALDVQLGERGRERRAVGQRDQPLVEGVVGVQVAVEVDEALTHEQGGHRLEPAAQLGQLARPAPGPRPCR